MAPCLQIHRTKPPNRLASTSTLTTLPRHGRGTPLFRPMVWKWLSSTSGQETPGVAPHGVPIFFSRPRTAPANPALLSPAEPRRRTTHVEAPCSFGATKRHRCNSSAARCGVRARGNLQSGDGWLPDGARRQPRRLMNELPKYVP